MRAHWLRLDDPFELIAKSLGGESDWKGDLESEYAVTTAEEVESTARHSVIWCERPGGGAVGVHLFRPCGVNTARLCEELRRLALEERDSAATGAGAASSIGGFHGERDLWSRSAFAASGLPELLTSAAKRAAQAELLASGAAEPPPMAELPEAWFNVNPNGAWNSLHTHPGCSFACVFFVARGDGSCATALDGRLALIPAAPEKLSAEDYRRVQRAASNESTSTSPALEFLLIDPEPGLLAVFPNFVPHFVLPHRSEEPGVDVGRELRVSVACNF